MENTPMYLPGMEVPKEKPATPAFVINISHNTLFREMCEFSRSMPYPPMDTSSNTIRVADKNYRAQAAREMLLTHLAEYKSGVAEAINAAIAEERESEKAAMAEKAEFYQNKAIEKALEFQKKLALERNSPAPTTKDATNLIEQIKNATEDAEYKQRIEGLLKTAIDAGWKNIAEHLDDFPHGERLLCPNSIINEENDRIICITFALNPARDMLQVCTATSMQPRSEPIIDVNYIESAKAKDLFLWLNSVFVTFPDSMKSPAEDANIADLTAQMNHVIAWIEEEIASHAAQTEEKKEESELPGRCVMAKVMITEGRKSAILARNDKSSVPYKAPLVCDFSIRIFDHYFDFMFGNTTVTVFRSEYPDLGVKEEFCATIDNLPVRDNWRPNGDKRDIPNYIFQTSGALTVTAATFIHNTLNEIYDWYISRMHPIEHRSSTKAVMTAIPAIEEGMQPLTVVAGKGVSVPPVEDGLESKNAPTRRLFQDIFSFRNSAERFEFFRELEDKCIAKIMLASSRRYDENLRSHDSIICPVALYESVPINFEAGQRVFLYIYELLPSSMSFIEHRLAYPCGSHSGVPEHRGLNYQPVYQGLRGESPTLSIDELRFDRFVIWHCHSDDPLFIKEEINGQLKWIHQWCHVMCQMPFAKEKEAHNE